MLKLMGEMQLAGKTSLTIDVEYVDNVSFLGDWKIILLTIKKVLLRKVSVQIQYL